MDPPGEEVVPAEKGPPTKELHKTVLKRVILNIEPEIFQIIPDSIHVIKEEKPKPECSVETTIIPTLNLCRGRIVKQKVTNYQVVYLLSKIKESLGLYYELTHMLNNIVTINEEITSNYFLDICTQLPIYGKKVEALKEDSQNSNSAFKSEGIDNLVRKGDLIPLVQSVQRSLLSLGTLVRAFRSVNKNVNEYMEDRREVIDKTSKGLENLLDLLNTVNNQLSTSQQEVSCVTDLVNIFQTEDYCQGIPPIESTADAPHESCAEDNTDNS